MWKWLVDYCIPRVDVDVEAATPRSQMHRVLGLEVDVEEVEGCMKMWVRPTGVYIKGPEL